MRLSPKYQCVPVHQLNAKVLTTSPHTEQHFSCSSLRFQKISPSNSAIFVTQISP